MSALSASDCCRIVSRAACAVAFAVRACATASITLVPYTKSDWASLISLRFKKLCTLLRTRVASCSSCFASVYDVKPALAFTNIAFACDNKLSD